jgi:hypothetical protein
MKCFLILLLASYIVATNAFNLKQALTANAFQQHLVSKNLLFYLSGLRDRGPGFKTGSRPLTFTKAITEFQNPTRCGVLMH